MLFTYTNQIFSLIYNRKYLQNLLATDLSTRAKLLVALITEVRLLEDDVAAFLFNTEIFSTEEESSEMKS